MKRVVVTGLGAITPIGNTLQTYTDGLKQGKSGASPITYFDTTNFKTKFACEVKDLQIGDFIHRKEARRMDLFTQYAMIIAEEAMQDSGIDINQINLDRVGCIWGSGIGGLRTLETNVSEHATRGINYATVSACASASHAIINSLDYIRLGKADIILTGGSEAVITMTGVGGFNAMKALSTRNDDPITASRPFDLDREGFVLGEGGAVLILEEYEHARKRGAKIYAEVAGGGMTADAYHITAPHPDGLGATNVMKLALADAKMNPENISYVNVHGTSTKLGDISESKAIKKVFKDHAYHLNISSTKSMIGHLLGAAGAVEAIAGIMAINENFVPPTINHFTDDPEIDNRLNFTFNEAQSRKVDAVLSNTFGFGGHNASVIFKRL